MNIVDVLKKIQEQDAEYVPYLGVADSSRVLVGHEVTYIYGTLHSVKRIYLEDLSYAQTQTRKRRKSSDVSQNKRAPQAQSSCVDEGRLSSIDLQARLAESC